MRAGRFDLFLLAIAMNPPLPVRGVWCAVLTPLDAQGSVDSARLVDHVRRLCDEGIDGVVPFGTTGEGQSFDVAERMAGLEALVAAGIPPARIVAGTGCAALPDTIALTRHAMAVGCAGALVLPPFFFKDVTDEGLYASYAALVDAIADSRLRLYLYHIPQVTAVPITAAVIERLRLAYPGIVAGLKDSAGDLVHSQAMLARFPDLAVLVGHEPHLPSMLAAGGAGTICGVANLFPRRMRRLFDAAGTRNEPDALAEITRLLDILLDYPLLPAMKALQAELTGDDAWHAVRPPLARLPTTARSAMLERLHVSRII
jgi:4-hydroxy-tetrahydrodipicolinate synthase